MGTLFKAVLITSPVLALVFFYVVSQQGKLDIEMQKEDAGFDRSWNEFEADFNRNKEMRQKYADRAKKADEKLKKLEEKAEADEKKAKKFEQEFEKAIEDFEKEQQGGKKNE